MFFAYPVLPQCFDYIGPALIIGRPDGQGIISLINFPATKDGRWGSGTLEPSLILGQFFQEDGICEFITPPSLEGVV